MDDKNTDKLKVYMADIPAYYAEVVSQLVLFVDELWMLQGDLVDPSKFTDIDFNPEEWNGYLLFISLLHNVLERKEKGKTPDGFSQFQTKALIAGFLKIREEEVRSSVEHLNTRLWESSSDVIMKKLISEPEIAVARAGFNIPKSEKLNNLNSIFDNKCLPRTKSLIKTANMANLVLKECLPTFHPKSLSHALDLREELSDYLVPFRSSMAKFAKHIQIADFDSSFEEQVYDIIIGEIQPQVKELNAVLKHPGKRILNNLISGGGISPILVGATVLSCIATIGGGALAASASVASISAATLTASIKANKEHREIVDPRKNGLALLLDIKR